MTRPPRPLRDNDRATATQWLRAFADELDADHAPHVQQAIATAAQAGYPATTSGAGGGGGSDPTSRPEALTITPDPAAVDAARLLRRQWALIDELSSLLVALRAWRPDRKVLSCPRCRNPIPDGRSRCNRVTEDGQRCGVCRDCDRVMCPGERMWDGRCDACRKRAARRPVDTGRVAGVARLHLDHTVIVDQEAGQ